jgi:hypothetical protein
VAADGVVDVVVVVAAVVAVVLALVAVDPAEALELGVAGADAGAEACELPDDELDEGLLECECDVLDPPNGSTYCWSPAEGPEAKAAAGPNRVSAARTRSQVIVARQKRIARVWQASPLGASGPPPRPPRSMCPQTPKSSFCRISCTARGVRQGLDGSC